ncbi:RHS repeat domain-containing protein [Streptomyces sp. NPDC006627]|uniref:RHS repeat domain-containing protein n=1 Tax=Streptomyces sp. NPDC006627 TaxID=3154679 RepID=UPI0033BE5D45
MWRGRRQHDHGESRCSSHRDPLGHRTTAYDAFGNVARRTDADRRVTIYGYDKPDQLTEVTAPGGAVTAYGYGKGRKHQPAHRRQRQPRRED